MKREEQKQLKEARSKIEAYFKQLAKSAKYKSGGGGYIYKVKDSFCFVIGAGISQSLDDQTLAIDCHLWCKSHPLDELFAQILGLSEEQGKQPFSFHLSGVWTAPFITLATRDTPYRLGDDVEVAAIQAYEWCNKECERWSKELIDIVDIEKLSKVGSNKQKYEVNAVLSEIHRGEYQGALQRIEILLGDKVSSGFNIKGRAFFDYAADYCKQMIL